MHRLSTTTVEISIKKGILSLVIFFGKHCLCSKRKHFICSWAKTSAAGDESGSHWCCCCRGQWDPRGSSPCAQLAPLPAWAGAPGAGSAIPAWGWHRAHCCSPVESQCSAQLIAVPGSSGITHTAPAGEWWSIDSAALTHQCHRMINSDFQRRWGVRRREG